MFVTKIALQKELKISEITARKIINNKELFNDYYYIKQSECGDLTNNIKLVQNIKPNSKQIKITNVLTKEEKIYNSMYDVSRDHGMARSTMRKYIDNNKEYRGFLWEYLNKP